ncbi:Hsp20/alpha crystallin family protein [Paenibacillus lautus]|uniref:Hsp20/alpha crystallin family protein n=1 Tax=Paenibacillus lautus TaxID=1401 RepID=UPI002DBD980B|nr:Hsp20/alpha crystallin family protein [Paenibacillus lautus]MEC0255745.1 Hsp20/alpha crystallin family protein [Paenibacillus lautus]
MNSRSKRPDWLTKDSFFNNKSFPFKDLNDLNEDFQLDPTVIEDYVKDTIRQATAGNEMLPNPSTLRYEMFDTHNFLVVKCYVPKRVHPENLGIKLNRTQIIIHGLPKDQSQTIVLPVPILPAQSIATYKQPTLQIKMPKMSIGRFHDVNIRFL